MQSSESGCAQIKLFPEELSINCLRLEQLPVGALLNSGKLRTLLSNTLNFEHLIPADCGLPRDYRGLGDLYKISYADGQKLSRTADPTCQLLATLELRNRKQKFDLGSNDLPVDGRVSTLIRNLVQLGRFDVIDDLLQEITVSNITPSLAETKMPHVPDQPLYELELDQESKANQLTLDDLSIGSQQQTYDAYVSYADCDLPFVRTLCEFLESPSIGLHLFIRERDLLIGTMQFHAFTELMEKRCKRLLIVLSPQFLQSAECEFQTRFTMSLQIQERQRKLIPILYRACELPAIIRFLSKIDLSRGDQIPQWTWRKLIFSLKPDTHSSIAAIPQQCFLPVSQLIPSAPEEPTKCEIVSTINDFHKITESSGPIITELSSLNNDSSKLMSSSTSTALLVNGKTGTSKNVSNSKQLFSKLWKKIGRTQLKQ